jgi:hypothetical protein
MTLYTTLDDMEEYVGFCAGLYLHGSFGDGVMILVVSQWFMYVFEFVGTRIVGCWRGES